ncbi:hypothetical protein L2E82_31593 [Cichorium intybus]|uniref:Uncharacterized protein n=1 Tax=Cichorium intybus TaxID=13427 RepID=A0ACB9BE01_CICIN|nr:hypothetical protein L2E82_31593 [Cichorium intybus]
MSKIKSGGAQTLIILRSSLIVPPWTRNLFLSPTHISRSSVSLSLSLSSRLGKLIEISKKLPLLPNPYRNLI